MGSILTVGMLPLGRIPPRLTFKIPYTSSQIWFNSTFITVAVENENARVITELHEDDIFAKIAVHDSAICVDVALWLFTHELRTMNDSHEYYDLIIIIIIIIYFLKYRKFITNVIMVAYTQTAQCL